MRKIAVVTILLSSCLLFGCASTEEKVDPKASFVGKKVDVLIAAIGEPKYTIDSTFDDYVASRTLVYPTGSTRGCIESYKVEVKSNVIIDYVCH